LASLLLGKTRSPQHSFLNPRSPQKVRDREAAITSTRAGLRSPINHPFSTEPAILLLAFESSNA